jgi:2-keto-4-pentenoate hydratase/2-oxohepta-3-ene-1,7-dioic acid hydratase in catechol pathway
MRFVSYSAGGKNGLAVRRGSDLIDLGPIELGDVLRADPASLHELGRSAKGAVIDERSIRYRPPIARPPKIICIGLNYADHATESQMKKPDYPPMFSRFSTTLIGHNEPIIRPKVSTQLDYEGELVAVIGKGGKHISRERAFDHIVGYSLFNEASVRDYQFKSSQWTVGKNFDGTGPFGPELVTADELPAGCKGLKIETRLNGNTLQSANTDVMIFPIADLIFYVSEAITLEPGDIIVTGTPSGVGFARKPPIWMKPGDVCEVEVEGIGVLRNPVKDEA